MTSFSHRQGTHPPPTRQSHISYALKPVPPPHIPIRSTQLQAVENNTTAAHYFKSFHGIHFSVHLLMQRKGRSIH